MRAMTAQMMELQRSVFRLIVNARRLSCRYGTGVLILKATSLVSVVAVSSKDLSLMQLRRCCLAIRLLWLPVQTLVYQQSHN